MQSQPVFRFPLGTELDNRKIIGTVKGGISCLQLSQRSGYNGFANVTQNKKFLRVTLLPCDSSDFHGLQGELVGGMDHV